MKFVVIILLIGIITALGSALRELMRPNSQSEKLVKALAIRVGLSLFLFFLLILSHKAGFIQPHDVNQWQP